uniref:Uncharacterized protein n=1 Tax=Siphoviridae sp. ctmpG14 TaxID=2825654 RepID=A0A8S5PB72_9CAUD|nr:MAG TPA: hypothetical protein [Siphoviridae sp. ctmpG14]
MPISATYQDSNQPNKHPSSSNLTDKSSMSECRNSESSPQRQRSKQPRRNFWKIFVIKTVAHFCSFVNS